MSSSKTLHLYGYGCGLGAARSGTQMGPNVMQQSPFLKPLSGSDLNLRWHKILQPIDLSSFNKEQIIADMTKRLGNCIYDAVQNNEFFCVLGGDHSCGMGTWSGLSAALKPKGDVGLIWIDAHMDSHTEQTSLTGNLHGMPLASLLGHGKPVFTQIISKDQKIKPENLCLIGARSFESGEAELLKKLNVRVFFIEEVKERGFSDVLEEAIQIVSKNTVKYGISFDLDFLDPTDAPGTGCPVPNGLPLESVFPGLQKMANDPKLAGFEIVEFDPQLDQEHKTEKIVARLIAALSLGKI